MPHSLKWLGLVTLLLSGVLCINDDTDKVLRMLKVSSGKQCWAMAADDPRWPELQGNSMPETELPHC